MNLRNVLRAYGLLRQLSDDESALLNILRALNDNDREQLVASMSDKPVKKAGKKSAGGGGGRSKRGESLKGQLGNRRQEQRIDSGACTFVLENGAVCNTGDNNPIHDKSFGYAGYHEFQSSVTTGKSDAQSAAGGS